MFTDNDLRELLDFSSSAPVLSIYLNTEPSAGNAETYRLRLRNLLKAVNLPQEVEQVERYIQLEYNWSGRGVAVFCCAPDGFFRAYPLQVVVRDLIFVGDRPSVKPLTDLLDSFGGYGVVLVDKQGARLFHFHLGELQEQEGVLGETVRHTKRGGASTMPGHRGGIAGRTNYMEEVVERNMKDSVDFAVHFFEEKHIRRIVIGGSDENVAMFRNLLPKAWQSLVAGTFTMPMTASQTDALNRALEIGQTSARQRETMLVDSLITAAAKNNGGVIGIEDTLQALNQDRIKTLVVAEGFRKTGYSCNECGALTTSKITCPQCGKDTVDRVQDVIEIATSTVLRHGGDIEIVHDNAALEQSGYIGARLRY